MPKTKKARYRVRNWKEYNKALAQRGSLTFWVDEDIIETWLNEEKNGKRGAPQTYTEIAIKCMASLGEIYHLPLRQTQGLMQSICTMMKLDLAVPDYSTLCRRRKELNIALPRRQQGEALHLVVDSIGVKIYGEGEWKVRQHGWSKHRTWRKLHIGVDESTGEIVVAALSPNSFADSDLLPYLLEQVEEEISQVSADGAYDTKGCYEAIAERGAVATIPPRQGARIRYHGNGKQKEYWQRDENLRAIYKHGRSGWKKLSGYHRRSIAENTFFRIKTIFGERVHARSFGGQVAQTLLRCEILNLMTHLGMPDSYVA